MKFVLDILCPKNSARSILQVPLKRKLTQLRHGWSAQTAVYVNFRFK